MPLNYYRLDSIDLFDRTTGIKIGSLPANESDFSLTCDNSCTLGQTDYLLTYEPCSIEINCDKQTIHTLCEKQTDSLYTLYFKELRQKRKHRKKRINKKWQKRYGYDVISYAVEGLRLETDDINSIVIFKR